ncbi:hypothetical protein BG011_001023, partial [Mortierella polycephala]
MQDQTLEDNLQLQVGKQRSDIDWRLPELGVAIRDMTITSGPLQQAGDGIHVMLKVPFEVWIQICKYLYPSQLVQLSVANKLLFDVVVSLPLWSQWLRSMRQWSSHRFDTYLRSLNHSTVPSWEVSRCGMRYMCARSFQVCEQCLENYNVTPVRAKLARLPLPVEFPAFKSIGPLGSITMETPSWTVRMCLKCRQDHYRVHVEPIPHDILGSYIIKPDARRKYNVGRIMLRHIHDFRYPEPNETTAYRRYPEERVLQMSRLRFGGD